MNKCILATCVLLAAGGTFAKSRPPQPTPEEIAARHARRSAEEYRSNGGRVRRPNAGKAHVVFVNCQTRVDDKTIRESAANLEGVLCIPFDCSQGAFDLNRVRVQGAASVFVVDNANYPFSLVAPEERWAMVNVARLGEKSKGAKVEARLSKALSRATVLLCGGAASNYQNNLMKSVTRAEQLDEIPDWYLPFDTIQKMTTYVAGLGIKPYEQATYLDACNEGWAPPPKDAIQKAIWEKVNAIPQNPIKIEFDPKKGR